MQLRDPEVDGADAGDELALAVAVAPVQLSRASSPRVSMISLTSDSVITLMSLAMFAMPSSNLGSRAPLPAISRILSICGAAFPRILTSAIKILGDNRFLLSTVREAAPYTNIRHAILGADDAPCGYVSSKRPHLIGC